MKVFKRYSITNKFLAFTMFLSLNLLQLMASTAKDSLAIDDLHSHGGAKTVRMKTNLLNDALLIPSIGFEFSYAEAWSVCADWKYAGWENDHRNRCWKGYGGDLELRRWLNAAKRDARLGSHVGVYVQSLNYDVEFGNRGYQSDGWHFGCGVSYGYSLRLAHRLHLDMTIGLGYLGGSFYTTGNLNFNATGKVEGFGCTGNQSYTLTSGNFVKDVADKIKIVYTVTTKDSKEPTGIVTINNSIQKTINLTLQAGKAYTFNLCLGLNSVETEAQVDSWSPKNDGTDEYPN